MGLKDVFANKKLQKLRKMEAETQQISRSISLGDSAHTESMKSHFPKETAALAAYAKQAEDLFQYIKANPEVVYMLKDIDVLPPFTIFPWLEPDSYEWEEGIGASYADLFKRMMNQKSPNEIFEYCNKHPYPDWWIQNPPCQPTLYQEYWEIDSAEMGYDDQWRHALCKKYRERHCSRYHTKDCVGDKLPN